LEGVRAVDDNVNQKGVSDRLIPEIKVNYTFEFFERREVGIAKLFVRLKVGDV
jgi:hypothetical protein